MVRMVLQSLHSDFKIGPKLCFLELWRKLYTLTIIGFFLLHVLPYSVVTAEMSLRYVSGFGTKRLFGGQRYIPKVDDDSKHLAKHLYNPHPEVLVGNSRTMFDYQDPQPQVGFDDTHYARSKIGLPEEIDDAEAAYYYAYPDKAYIDDDYREL